MCIQIRHAQQSMRKVQATIWKRGLECHANTTGVPRCVGISYRPARTTDGHTRKVLQITSKVPQITIKPPQSSVPIPISQLLCPLTFTLRY